MTPPKLIIFDADGTLIDRESGQWLPNVLGTIAALPKGTRLAVATNQGGPACRDAGWAWSGQFPALAEVEARYTAVAETIGARLYMALAYKSSKGDWYVPTAVQEDDPRLQRHWRKPSPGMLVAAMSDTAVGPMGTLMVGDGEDDRLAAGAVGCAFMWAKDFFAWRHNA